MYQHNKIETIWKPVTRPSQIWMIYSEEDSMHQYHKIETLWKRDLEGTKKLMPGVFRDETVEFLATNRWVWTEKVDGTNIRVHWDGYQVSFGGRTDRASIPAPLVNKLNEYFGGEKNAQIFEQQFGDKEVILFGEGYGKGIQKVGADYIRDGVDFILFDLLIGDNYQTRESVEKCAEAFGVKVVPIVGYGNLYDAVRFVSDHPTSTMGVCEMEGIVCRPFVELRSRGGSRVIVKIKYNDVKELGS